jgi:hypothetical protein
MGNDGHFRTNYTFVHGVTYVFLSLDRNLTGQECEELAKKYFESHHQPLTLPGQALIVDVRPAFQKPLSVVTPTIRRLD